jgi:hypothetical protein
MCNQTVCFDILRTVSMDILKTALITIQDFDAILIPTQHWYVLEMESVSVWGGRMCYVIVWQVQHFDAKYLIYCFLRFWHNH